MRSPPWRWPARTLHSLLAAVLVAWAAWQCFGPSPAPGISLSTYDTLQQRRLWASAPDPRLLIIDIDEASLAELSAEFGRWPWPRDTLATLLEHARREGASALVFDILFADPDRLRPGGDQALAAAARNTRIGIFPVVRLPARLDARSELAIDQVPGLASPPPAPAPAASAPTVALILPFMRDIVDGGRLGSHTALRDGDGKFRRFALTEPLPGGWQLRSLPAAVAHHLGSSADTSGLARPVVWRRSVDAYPRVPFWVAWSCAEGRPRADCPVLRDRIVLVGASATALHDVQATPLSNQHAGIDILATLVDNALHDRAYRELPVAGRFALALAAIGLAWWLVRRGAAGATQAALFGLPTLLLLIGYASLHTEWLYLDLLLPAGLALTFLGTVATLDTLRRRWLEHAPNDPQGPFAIVAGAAAASAERLERAVFDVAAFHRLTVGGGRASCGQFGTCQAVWVLWGLATEAEASALARRIANDASGSWGRPWVPGSDPHAALLGVLADAPGQPATRQADLAQQASSPDVASQAPSRPTPLPKRSRPTEDRAAAQSNQESADAR